MAKARILQYFITAAVLVFANLPWCWAVDKQVTEEPKRNDDNYPSPLELCPLNEIKVPCNTNPNSPFENRECIWPEKFCYHYDGDMPEQNECRRCDADCLPHNILNDIDRQHCDKYCPYFLHHNCLANLANSYKLVDNKKFRALTSPSPDCTEACLTESPVAQCEGQEHWKTVAIVLIVVLVFLFLGLVIFVIQHHFGRKFWENVCHNRPRQRPAQSSSPNGGVVYHPQHSASEHSGEEGRSLISGMNQGDHGDVAADQNVPGAGSSNTSTVETPAEDVAADPNDASRRGSGTNNGSTFYTANNLDNAETDPTGSETIPATRPEVVGADTPTTATSPSNAESVSRINNQIDEHPSSTPSVTGATDPLGTSKRSTTHAHNRDQTTPKIPTDTLTTTDTEQSLPSVTARQTGQLGSMFRGPPTNERFIPPEQPGPPHNETVPMASAVKQADIADKEQSHHTMDTEPKTRQTGADPRASHSEQREMTSTIPKQSTDQRPGASRSTESSSNYNESASNYQTFPSADSEYRLRSSDSGASSARAISPLRGPEFPDSRPDLSSSMSALNLLLTHDPIQEEHHSVEGEDPPLLGPHGEGAFSKPPIHKK